MLGNFLHLPYGAALLKALEINAIAKTLCLGSIAWICSL